MAGIPGGKSCTECDTELTPLATDRGYWYWCSGCGTVFKQTNGWFEKFQSPGTLAALRLAFRQKPPPT